MITIDKVVTFHHIHKPAYMYASYIEKSDI